MQNVEAENFAGNHPEQAKNDSRDQAVAPFYLDIQKKLSGDQIKQQNDNGRYQIHRLVGHTHFCSFNNISTLKNDGLMEANHE